MLKTLIYYQMYIIIGILIFPIFAFTIYIIKKIIDRIKFIKTLRSIKKPLIEKINNLEIIYELKEQQEEMNMLINAIKGDIYRLKKDIEITQEEKEQKNINDIEKDISAFYEQIHKKEEKPKTETEFFFPESLIIKEPSQEIYIPSQTHQSQSQQQNILQKEQTKIMNENISKFLIMYREKDKIIEEKNKSIYILQQKLLEAEHKIKKLIEEQQKQKNKDKIIEEKTKIITTLQQRLQEVEHKFKKIALLHKSIIEREGIKDKIITEKNQLIIHLQNKLTEIENKLQNMMMINEEIKEKFINKKLFDIDEQIKKEKRKNIILIILFILMILIGIGGSLFIYTYYLKNITTYAI